jgi:hypothetical protein
MAGIFDVNFGGILTGAADLTKEIGAAIRGNVPVDLNKLAELEEKMAELQAQADKNTVDDRTSARALGAEYVKAGKTNWRQNILAALAMLSLMGFIIALFVLNIKPDIRDMLNIILGGLLKIVYDIYGYDFGGSFGSEQKNNMITDMIAKFKK